MSSLEKCKDLLQEVINELRNTPEGRSSNEAPKIPSTAGGAGGDVPSSSSGASAPPPSRVNSSIHEEHRRLFGYNPRFNPYNRSTRRSGQKRAVKAGPKKVQTWTRQFVCLAKREQTSPPQLWEYSRLQAAGLGQKKITLDLDDTPLDVDLKLKEAFPKLEDAGGYCMMRTGQGARTLMVISGPYSTETIKDFMGQGKVFIRPLQKDLSMDAVESTTLEGDLLEKCFNCNKNFFLSELGSHLYSCGANNKPVSSDVPVIDETPQNNASFGIMDGTSQNIANYGIMNTSAENNGSCGITSETSQNFASCSVMDGTSQDIVSSTGTIGERSTCCSAQTTSSDLHQLKQIFPENDVTYLERVLENCGSVTNAVAEILGDKESPTHETSNGIADEVESIPLAAVGMVTPEDESAALTRFIQGAVSSFGVEVDLHVKRGQDILPQMIRKYKNPSFDVTKPLNVQFVGADEIGIDAGGITKEYFHFLVESLKQHSPDGITLLEGTVGHLLPKHDYELLSSGMFVIMGKMILHAVLNNCQGISGMSPAIVKYIVTGKRDSSVEDISLEDIPDPCLKEQLKQLVACDEKDLPSFTTPDKLDSISDILLASGFPYLEITAQNRSLAYECFLLYEVLTKRIPALEDIRKGLASVRVQGITLLDLLRIHPNLKEHVFPQYNDIVDITMFKMAVEFEESDREAEKQARVFLEKYIDDVARREEESGETLKDLLQFWTGYPQLPRDTSCKLWVKYCPEQSTKVLAEADTCTVTLRIPTTHQHYEDFKKFMDCSIAHGKVGFGRM